LVHIHRCLKALIGNTSLSESSECQRDWYVEQHWGMYSSKFGSASSLWDPDCYGSPQPRDVRELQVELLKGVFREVFKCVTGRLFTDSSVLGLSSRVSLKLVDPTAHIATL
jgi:hypothetical protein